MSIFESILGLDGEIDSTQQAILNLEAPAFCGWLKDNPDPEGAFAIAWLRHQVQVAKFDAALNYEPFASYLSEPAQYYWDLSRSYWRGASLPTPQVLQELLALSAPDSLSEPIEKFLRGSREFYLAQIEVLLGDYRSARERFDVAAECVRALCPTMKRGIATHKAALLQTLGYARDALLIHTDENMRADAVSVNDHRYKLCSHLLAAKCALDIPVAAKANYELIEAQEVLDSCGEDFPRERAYLVLYSAELDTLWGNEREGVHLFEHAIELFESLSPPCYPGVLDAKIGLIQFALRQEKYPEVFRTLGELLDDAQEHGCLEARGRLIAYQARLLIDKKAPLSLLSQGYEDLVHRAHLINNPRLTFMVYSDLYTYAREYLAKEEQSFWLKRVQGLQAVLEQSCYKDLYDDYVLERYRHEIEKHLDLADFEF